MGVVINSAQLRVYLPADRAGRFDTHAFGRRRIVRASDDFVWEEPTKDDAFTTEWNGRAYACPRFPRLRMMEGVLAFRHANPGSALTSELAVRHAASELAAIRTTYPAARSYILTAPWHVPLRWFSAFDPSDRDLYEAPHGTSIRYRSLVSDAVERVAHTADVLEESGFDDHVVEDVADLERWLREFAGDAMVELDYHTVARLFPDAELAFDESGTDVVSSIAALEESDVEAAGVAYARVAARWAPVQALAYLN